MRKLFDAFRGLVYTAGFLLLWGYVALWARGYDAALSISLPAWTHVPGIVCMVLGAAFALTCVGAFAMRGRGTPAPFDAPRQLVAVGPYRWVRNPMYLGGGLVVVGYAFYERSVSILLLAAAMWVAAHMLVYFYEEPVLREKFDGSYADYCRSVWRWFPRAPHGQRP